VRDRDIEVKDKLRSRTVILDEVGTSKDDVKSGYHKVSYWQLLKILMKSKVNYLTSILIKDICLCNGGNGYLIFYSDWDSILDIKLYGDCTKGSLKEGEYCVLYSFYNGPYFWMYFRFIYNEY
jgi:hypothetical protein